MFEVGDIVEYKDITGKVIFCCEGSLSILIGAELPKQTQTRIVVYNHSWGDVTVSECVDQNRVLYLSRQEFTQK